MIFAKKLEIGLVKIMKNKIYKIITPIKVLTISIGKLQKAINGTDKAMAKALHELYHILNREQIIWDDFKDKIKDRIGENNIDNKTATS